MVLRGLFILAALAILAGPACARGGELRHGGDLLATREGEIVTVIRHDSPTTETMELPAGDSIAVFPFLLYHIEQKRAAAQVDDPQGYVLAVARETPAFGLWAPELAQGAQWEAEWLASAARHLATFSASGMTPEVSTLFDFGDLAFVASEWRNVWSTDREWLVELAGLQRQYAIDKRAEMLSGSRSLMYTPNQKAAIEALFRAIHSAIGPTKKVTVTETGEVLPAEESDGP